MSSTVLHRAACAVVASLVISGMASAAITIETVPVGNAGNAADPYTGYGSVAYEYNIGKYEVTAGQYTAFLNAVGGEDTYWLYNTSMASTTKGCGISRVGSNMSENPWIYSVAPSFVNRPVNYVSLGDSMRFANWLHNGQPTGTQNASTTEDGTYFVNGTTSDEALSAITRKNGATWAVISGLEWYKAAYHKNNGTGVNSSYGEDYFYFPTSSDTTPGRDMTDTSGNNANFYAGPGYYPIDSGIDTTVVGEFQNSASPYGTFDQGGNVYEWNEDGVLRGGCFYSSGYQLRTDSTISDYPTREAQDFGLRVSQVPEPGSIAVLVLGVSGLLARRRGAGR